MSAMIRVTAVVQPGGRVEFTAPELAARAGETVELQVSPPVVGDGGGRPPGMNIFDWILSPRPSTKTPEEWEQFEKEFQEMRNEWDR